MTASAELNPINHESEILPGGIPPVEDLQSPERGDVTESHMDAYTRFSILYQPDLFIDFLEHAKAGMQHPIHGPRMQELLGASAEYLQRFNIDPYASQTQLVINLLRLRTKNTTLPPPTSIPPLDLTCFKSISVVDQDVLAVDFDTNSIFEAGIHTGEDPSARAAAVFQKAFYAFKTGATNTNLRLYVPSYFVSGGKSMIGVPVDSRGVDVKAELNYLGGSVNSNQLTPEHRLKLGKSWGLQNLIERNHTMFWYFPGFAGGIDAFDDVCRGNIQTEMLEEYPTAISYMTIGGLGNSTSEEDKVLKDVFGIRADKSSIRRYGQKIFETNLMAGIAGDNVNTVIEVGYSAGAAGLLIGESEMTKADRLCAESHGHRPSMMNEEMRYFKGYSFNFLNPAVSEGVPLVGSYKEGSTLREKVIAMVERKIVELGNFSGNPIFKNIPYLDKIVNLSTKILMGLEDNEGVNAVKIHAQNIRYDTSIPEQAEAIRQLGPISDGELGLIMQNNAPTYFFLAVNDIITPYKVQIQALSDQVQRMERQKKEFNLSEMSYSKPVVFKFKTSGHGLPYSELMKQGYKLMMVLSTLNLEERELLSSKMDLVQQIIDGTLPQIKLNEIAEQAAEKEISTNNVVAETLTADRFQWLYPELTGGIHGLRDPKKRLAYLGELIRLQNIEGAHEVEIQVPEDPKTPEPPSPGLLEHEVNGLPS